MKKFSRKDLPLKKRAISIAVLLMLGGTPLCLSAQQQEYNDGSSAMLVNANDPIFGTSLAPWTGLSSSDKGVIFQDPSGGTVFNGADVAINYNNSSTPEPKFVIGGYTQNSMDYVTDNSVTIKNGNVDGDVYGGFSQSYVKTDDLSGTNSDYLTTSNPPSYMGQSAANENTVIIEDGHNITITGNIFGGNASVWIKTGNVDSTEGQVQSSADAGFFTREANGNSVIIGSTAKVDQNVYGGFSSLTAQSGNALSNGSSATSAIYPYYSNYKASSNEVTINSNVLVGQNIYGGAASIKMMAGLAESNSTNSGAASATVLLSGSTVESNNNHVTINGFNHIGQNIYGGFSFINIQGEGAHAYATDPNGYADATAQVEATSLNSRSDENVVTVASNNTVGQNIYGGASSTTLQTGDTKSNVSMATARSSSTYSTISTTGNIIAVANSNTIDGSIYGGHASLNIKTGTTNAGNYAESQTEITGTTFKSDDNEIVLDSNVFVGQDIYGGFSSAILQSGNANTSRDAAYAFSDAYSSSFSSSKNRITVSDESEVGQNIYGGSTITTLLAGETKADQSAAQSWTGIERAGFYTNENTITVGNNSKIGQNIYGSSIIATLQAGKATANEYDARAEVNARSANFYSNENNVTVGDHTQVDQNIYATSIIATLQAGEATANQYGAQAWINAESTYFSANENNVSIGNNSQIGESIYGASIIATLQAGEATTGQYDAQAWINAENANFTANENNVIIGNNSQIGKDIYGASIIATFQAGEATTDQMDAQAWTTLANSNFSANANTVTIGDDSHVNQNIYGGSTLVSIHSGSAITDDMASAYTNLYGARIEANNNAVQVGTGTVIGQNIYGGSASITVDSGHATSTSNADANQTFEFFNITANDNAINFDGTLQGGALYGGKVNFDISANIENNIQATTLTTDSSAYATGNQITIGQNAIFNGNTSSLYGGYFSYNITDNIRPQNYDFFTGNVLNYNSKTPATFTTIGNFENYNFTITPELANSTVPLMNAQDIIMGSNTSNISDGSAMRSTATVVGIYSGNVLYADDHFILMQSNNPFIGDDVISKTDFTQVQQGISLIYDVRTDIDTTNNQVTATILGCNTIAGNACPQPPVVPPSNPGGGGGAAARVNPQLKALSEGYLSNSMLVIRGADLMANEAVGAIREIDHNNGWVPFAIASAQHNRYNSGSHIKSNDFLMTGGLTFTQNNLTTAAVIEGGWGNYDSYNSFNNAASVKGSGDNNYYGLGLLGRYDFNNGIYAEGSARYGWSHVKFNTDDIINLATLQNARYDLDTHYTSAHAGIGYIMPLDKNNNLDISAKYLWTTIQGNDVNVASDNIHFDRVNSNRVRLDAKLNHQYSDTVILRAGFGYEYEFDTKSKATTYDVYRIDAPDVQGSTGIISLGASIKPTENSGLTLDFKAQGYAGKREGVGFNLTFNYAF